MIKPLLKYGLALLGCGWAWLAAAQDGDRIWVNGQINGQPVRLIFDTGMSSPVLFKPAADRLKLKVEAPPANVQPKPGETLVSRSEMVDFAVQSFALRVQFPVLELPAYATDSPGDGILSLRAIPAKVYAFDVFYDQLDLRDTLPLAAMSWPKFPLVANVPALGFTVGGEDPERVNVGVDTGNPDGVSLSPPLWAKFLAKNGGQPATLTAYYNPGAGLLVKTQIWAKEIVLGGLTLKDVPVQEMAALENSPELVPKNAAWLGLFALRKMNLVVDEEARTVYARPQERPFLKYQHNQLGAVFVPLHPSADALIARVVPGGPAAEAGIRDGDELLKIEGEDVTHWRARGGVPYKRFCTGKAGTVMGLTLKREGREYEAKPALRRLIGPGSAASRAENTAKLRTNAEQGDAEAQMLLGQMCLAGSGVAKDEAEAVKWLRLAAGQNQAQAQLSLGMCFAQGTGVKKDEAEAAKWLRRAAEQNQVEAQAMLGICYSLGRGVAEDPIEAYKWLFLASEQGNEKAKKACALITGQLSASQIAEGQKRARQVKK